LYVVARYPPLVGGTEVHTAEIAKRMRGRGHDVTVLTTTVEAGSATTDVEDGTTVVRVRAWPRRADWYFAPGVVPFIARRRWDIVHCQGYHTLVAPLAMGAAIASRQPFVVTFHSGGHSSWVRRRVRPLQRRLLRPGLKRADRLIGVSEFETEFFRRRLRLARTPFVTIPSGVSREFLDSPPHPPSSRPVICSVGRLERYKGHHRVISALPEVRRLVPGAILRIVGDGSFRPQLEALAAQHGVQDYVEFLVIAPRERSRMADMFSSATVVTMLSQYESQGMMGLEALAVGRPLIVGEDTALAELGRYGDITIVPSDADDRTIATAIAEKVRAKPSVGRDLVPGWDTTVDALESLYFEIVPSERRVDPLR